MPNASSELGAPRVVTTGNLKLDVPAPPADGAKLAALADAIAGRPVIAAASTHAGEEAIDDRGAPAPAREFSRAC